MDNLEIPKSLDDISYPYQYKYMFSLSRGDEIEIYKQEIVSRTPNEILDEWSFITLYPIGKNLTELMLLGNTRYSNVARLCRRVKKVDLDKKLVLTEGNYVYELGRKLNGDPSPQQLMTMRMSFYIYSFEDLL